MSAATAKTPTRPPRNPLWGDTRKFSPVTYAPADMLDRSEDDPIKLRWFAENCEKLADFMARLQPGRHQQSTWVSQDSDRAHANECGTAACALSWAALSQVIPGLQYTIHTDSNGNVSFFPTIEGKPMGWGRGWEFFGRETQRDIFEDAYLTKDDVIEKLREQAKEYREQAVREES